jgi:cyclopropane fatty-acyl-phospholipid synthase-like methyltransferase
MNSEMTSLLDKPEFPRSNHFDPAWMLDNQMGPNAVWLAEWLTGAMEIEPEMRVLDLGCGRAMTSIFLARELKARVWAAVLWIGPDNNWQRVLDAGVADRVCPLRAEAHSLPFAQGFFDAVISVDAYQYFGTDELYLGYLSHFVREGGQIGVVMPGLTRAIGEVPAHLLEVQQNGKVFWEDECYSFKTAEWWREHWGRCSKVFDVRTETLEDGWRHWRDFEKALELAGKGIFPSDVETLERDAGQNIGFVRALARRGDGETMNLGDPSIGVRFGVD